MVTVTVLDDGSVDVQTLNADAIVHADIAPDEGFIQKTAANLYTAHKSNLTAVVSPGVTDDSAAGYTVSSVWIDVTADKYYVNVDASVGAAVWLMMSVGAGSGDVTAVGTPADSQIAVWVTPTSIEGDADFLWDQTDLTIYRAVNDSPPSILLGSRALEQLKITPVYDSGAQTLDRVDFITSVASATADRGLYRFSVDDVAVLDIDDGGLTVAVSGGLSFGAVNILSDSSGTTTLNNIDALDATTIATFDAALGFGNVSNTGTPVNDQIPVWTNATTIEGSNDFSNDGTTFVHFNPVNDGDPIFRVGANGVNSGFIAAGYESGTQVIDEMALGTATTSAAADAGRITLLPDGLQVAQFDDGGLDFTFNRGISINGTDILTDSSGTATLSNIDVLDATTVATIDAAIGEDTIGFTAQSTTGDGTTTIDWRNGNKFNFQFGAFNETFTFTAPNKPCNLLLKLVQDSVGSRTATWPATVKWRGGSAPILTTLATDGTDIIALYFDGTNYFSVASLDFF